MASIDVRGKKWRVRWRGLDGRAHARSCPSLAVAESLKMQVEQAIASGHEWRPRDLAVVPPSLSRMGTRLLNVPLWSLSGVYFLVSADGEVVYVGQAKSVHARIGQHAKSPDKAFTSAFFLPVPVADLSAVESAFIRAMRPRLNRGHLRHHDQDEAAILARYGFTEKP